MATWGEFAEARPEMAQVLLGLLDWIPITYLATVRRDGSPRVHPVCPIIAGGRMFVAVAGSSAPEPSPKRFDLARDGRYAMHALPGKRDDEFYITGRARLSRTRQHGGWWPRRRSTPSGTTTGCSSWTSPTR